MRILIVNYRYFVSGGPETYMFNVTDALERRGHTVIPYSVRYSKNRPTEYSKYFADPIGSEDSVYFSDHDRSFRTTYRTLRRTFYDKDVERSIRRCIQETKPDVAYVLHYKRKLSPAVLVGLKKEGIPTIVRFSDFLSVCPQSLLLRNGKPCKKCVEDRTIFPSVKYKCVKNSLLASLINFLSTFYHNLRRFESIPVSFIVPSDFSSNIFIEAGFHKEQIHTIPTFAPESIYDHINSIDASKPLQLLYAGNLETYKGIHTAVQVMPMLKAKYGGRIQLVIAGNGSEEENIRIYIKENQLDDSIVMLGHVDRDTLNKYYSSCYAVLIPSLCYENLPNVLIESMAWGIPVIGSNHGSIGEHIANMQNGLLVDSNNIEDWYEAICMMLDNVEQRNKMSANALAYAKQEFCENIHISKLISLINTNI